MKLKKAIFFIFIGYLGLVIVFETFLGIIQPRSTDTMVITSFDASGEATKRVVSRLERGGQIFVAVNHWPRAWARRIQLNPNVQITYGEITRNYNAVVLKGEDHLQASCDFAVPFLFRILTGFPPRYFFRFESLEGVT